MQWIKVQTDIFDNPKMRAIVAESESKALLWFKMLTTAGQMETGGRFEFRSGKPYSVAMLAGSFGVSLEAFKEALETFLDFEMVEFDGETLVLSGWEKYQSIEAEERQREKNRERQRRFKERRSVEGNAEVTPEKRYGNVTGNAEVTPDNALDIDIDKDKDKEKDKKRKAFHAPSLEEVRDYCKERGNKVDPEAFVDFYASKGWRVGNQPMKDWKAAVRTWEKRERTAPAGQARKTTFHNFEQRETAGGSWDELDTYRPEADAAKEQEDFEALMAGFRRTG